MANAANIERALIKKLQALPPPWATKLPGIPYTPNATLPWQRVTVLPAAPETVAFGNGAYSRVQILAQVDLYYPVRERRVDFLYNRAEAVRDWFMGTSRRGAVLQEADTLVHILRLPGIGPLIESGATHHQITVEVYAFADDCPGAA